MKNVHIFDIDYDITEDDIPDGMTEDEVRASLPQDLVLREDIDPDDSDAVGNFISDETGFFHKGYHLSTDPE